VEDSVEASSKELSVTALTWQVGGRKWRDDATDEVGKVLGTSAISNAGIGWAAAALYTQQQTKDKGGC